MPEESATSRYIREAAKRAEDHRLQIEAEDHIFSDAVGKLYRPVAESAVAIMERIVGLSELDSPNGNFGRGQHGFRILSRGEFGELVELRMLFHPEERDVRDVDTLGYGIAISATVTYGGQVRKIDSIPAASGSRPQQPVVDEAALKAEILRTLEQIVEPK